jgi:hypothetical protein
VKRTTRQRLAAAAAALGLAACDATSPPEAAVVAPEPAGSPSDEEVPPSVDPTARAAARAIAEAVRDEDAFARARRLALLLPTLGPEGVAGAREALVDPTLNPGGAEIELLVRFWASHEPEEATRWAAKECPAGYRFPAVLSSLSVWAALDPQAASSASLELESDPSTRDPAQIALVRGWFESDPDALARYIQAVGMGFGRQRLLSSYIRLLLQQEGPEALKRWAESLPEDDPGFKQEVYRQVAVGLPPFDLDAAFRWCEAHCDGPYGKELRGIIALRWAQLGGGAPVLEWLARAPAGGERDGTLPMILAEWARQEPEQASAWMEAQSAAGNAEPWWPLLFPAYAMILLPSSPSEAIRWAERVQHEGTREALLVRIARDWRSRDEAAAEAWLGASPLSEEARQKVRGVKPAPAPDGPAE